jgi:hypothetical protein
MHGGLIQRRRAAKKLHNCQRHSILQCNAMGIVLGLKEQLTIAGTCFTAIRHHGNIMAI